MVDPPKISVISCKLCQWCKIYPLMTYPIVNQFLFVHVYDVRAHSVQKVLGVGDHNQYSLVAGYKRQGQAQGYVAF